MLSELDRSPRARYEERLDGLIEVAIAAGSSDFRGICRACQGAFPTDVAAALQRRDVPVDLTQISGPSHLRLPLLPEPHPVDFEWRFTAHTANRLATRIAKRGGSVACFGTPTVFLAFRAQGVPAVLFDRNPILCSSLQGYGDVHLTDLNTPVQADEIFDVVIMDPPWYPDYMSSWLANALQVTRPGATLVTTLIPSMTRPSAEADGAAYMNILEQVGVVAELPFRAIYETPLFELECLRAEQAALPDWRTSKFLSVETRVSEPLAPVSPSATRHSWERFVFGSQVVALRMDEGPEEASITARSIYSDGHFLLRSVSRRDAAREEIGLWTSRNRCLRITGVRRLSSFLNQVSRGTPPSAALTMTSRGPQETEALRAILALIGW